MSEQSELSLYQKPSGGYDLRPRDGIEVDDYYGNKTGDYPNVDGEAERYQGHYSGDEAGDFPDSDGEAERYQGQPQQDFTPRSLPREDDSYSYAHYDGQPHHSTPSRPEINFPECSNSSSTTSVLWVVGRMRTSEGRAAAERASQQPDVWYPEGEMSNQTGRYSVDPGHNHQAEDEETKRRWALERAARQREERRAERRAEKKKHDKKVHEREKKEAEEMRKKGYYAEDIY